MITGIILTLILIAGVYYFTFYPNQKIKRIRSSVLLEVDGADNRYPDLPLGNLGIFCEVNEKRRIRVVFPKLTLEGGVLYIYSWHDLQSIHIPALKNTKRGRVNFKIAQGLAFLIKEHIQFVEPEILNLRQQEHKLNRLFNLVGKSEFYSSQQEIYKRALFQIKNLIDKAEELQQVYIRFIREVLIGKQVAGYDLNRLSSNSFTINSQYKRVKDEYQTMKDTAKAYAELSHTSKV